MIGFVPSSFQISFEILLNLNMSSAIRFSPSLKSPIPRTTVGDGPRAFPLNIRTFPFSSLSLHAKSLLLSGKIRVIRGRDSAVSVSSEEGYSQELDDEQPVSVELQPICSETQFDQIIAEAQQLQQPLILVWMASWCRKCIYLEPKLEELAAEYYPRLRFYCVDVNAVPHKFVARAGVTKMPTIQLWKDMKKQAEVIGGHKAYLVVNEIRQMIENE